MELRQITKEELREILAKHKLWLDTRHSDDIKGEKADLRDAELSGADLRGADLSGAKLHGADLRYADLDYAVMPLWCGDLNAHYDDRQIIQQLYHVLSHAQNSKNCSDELKKALLIQDLTTVANKFHRVDECGELEAYSGGM